MPHIWFDRHIRRPGTFETFHFLFPVHHECAEGCFGLQSKDGNDCMGKAIFASHWDWHDYMVVVFAYSRDNSPQFCV